MYRRLTTVGPPRPVTGIALPVLHRALRICSAISELLDADSRGDRVRELDKL
jgi:hypothetical protein